jgi:hypothetical protein
MVGPPRIDPAALIGRWLRTLLPQTFTYTDACAAGISKRRLYEVRDEGQIEQFGHDLFQKSDRDEDADIDLIEIAIRAPKAALCLTTALARHGLTEVDAMREVVRSIAAIPLDDGL